MDESQSLWSTFISFTADYADPLGIWLGILLAVPILATWYQVTVGKRRLHRRWLNEIRANRGSRPAILVVDLLERKSLLSSVERHCASADDLKAIPRERVFVISRNKHIDAEDMAGFSAELRNKASEILQSSTDELHVFFGGPCIVGALIGAEFANACRVILYHQQQGGYLNWGPLRHFPLP